MDTEQPLEADKVENHRHDFSSYLITHLPEAAKSIPLAREILRSSSNGEKRSLGDDMREFNEIYKTKIEIDGQENIPTEGGFIFAISHTSATLGFPGWRDKEVNPMWVLAGVYDGLRNVRGEDAEIRLIAIDPTSINRPVGSLVKNTIQTYNGFPINKFNPKSALETINAARQALDNENAVLLISPEGEENTNALGAKRGVARLAESGKPVIPVAFVEEKTESGYTHTVKFGPPLQFENPEALASLPRAEARTKEIKFADKVGHAIADLLPEEMRGVYR